MTDEKTQNLTNPDLWLRLIYMILFALLSGLARIVIFLIAAVQFLFVLFSGEDNINLRVLGNGISQWTMQTYQFLCFASEQKPYPFQDWPVSTADSGEKTPETVLSTKTTGKPSAGEGESESANESPNESSAQDADKSRDA